MGRYSKMLSERGKHTKIVSGYCVICGKHGVLSKDHVPPQGSITVTKVEQFHLTEVFGLDRNPVQGIPSMNGSKFRTICRECNMTALGANDGEIADVCRSLTRKINHFFTAANSPVSRVHTPVNAVRYCRAMIGHILAATSVTECRNPPQETPYFTPLQQFVLGDDYALDATHDIYYWFFPYRYHQSIKLFTIRNDGNQCCMSILSFFPLAFLLTEKGKGIFPAGAEKLELSHESLLVSLSALNVNFSSFPAVGLSGDQMIALASHLSIVSYPIS